MSPARLLRARVQAVFAVLPLALLGREEGIHELRVSARRLRFALPLLAARPAGRRVRRARRGLRALLDAAAVGRDLDVMHALLSAEPAERPEPRALLRRLGAARRRRKRRLFDALLDLDLAALRRELRSALAHGPLPPGELCPRLQSACALQAQLLGAQLAALGARFDSGVLHTVRIGLRRLRYLAELAEVLSGGADAAVRDLRQQQLLLGDVHDAWVLAEWLEAQEAAAARSGNEALAGAAGQARATFLERSRERHAAWLSGEPERGLADSLERLGRTIAACGC